MKKKKTVISANYLDKIPLRSEGLQWTVDDDGIVTLAVENRGWVNRISQKLFKAPKISYIHLDKFGSYVWQIIDGESDITALGVKVEEHFGEEAHPLYERLAQYFRIIESYRFVSFK